MATVGVALLAGNVLLSSYQPLTPEHAAGPYGVRVLTATAGLTRWYNSPGPASHPIWVEPHGRFRVEMITTIYNNGPFPITVTKIGAPDASATHVRAFFDTFGNLGYRGGAPLQPFTITGHEQQTIAVHWLQTCRAGRDSRVVLTQRLPVTFTFLGYRHTVRVYTPPLALRLQPSC